MTNICPLRCAGSASSRAACTSTVQACKPSVPRQTYVGVYRTDAAAAAQAWRDSTRLREHPSVESQSLAVTHWNASLTKDQVLHPTAAFLLAQEAARERMGNDYYQPRVTRIEIWEKAALPRPAKPGLASPKPERA